MPLTKSKIKDLNAEIQYHEVLFRRGEISYEEYEAKREDLIRKYHMRYREEDLSSLRKYENDSEPPHDLLGILLSMIRKLF
jgi:hypothetical protein